MQSAREPILKPGGETGIDPGPLHLFRCKIVMGNYLKCLEESGTLTAFSQPRLSDRKHLLSQKYFSCQLGGSRINGVCVY